MQNVSRPSDVLCLQVQNISDWSEGAIQAAVGDLRLRWQGSWQDRQCDRGIIECCPFSSTRQVNAHHRNLRRLHQRHHHLHRNGPSHPGHPARQKPLWNPWSRCNYPLVNDLPSLRCRRNHIIDSCTGGGGQHTNCCFCTGRSSAGYHWSRTSKPLRQLRFLTK